LPFTCMNIKVIVSIVDNRRFGITGIPFCIALVRRTTTTDERDITKARKQDDAQARFASHRLLA
jgi:hypothetical protein